jgi:ABC-type hemin transport system substrate-binding protein
MKIDGDRYDFVSNMQDRRAVLTMIDEALLKLGKLTPEEYRRLQEKLEKKSIAE